MSWLLWLTMLFALLGVRLAFARPLAIELDLLRFPCNSDCNASVGLWGPVFGQTAFTGLLTTIPSAIASLIIPSSDVAEIDRSVEPASSWRLKIPAPCSNRRSLFSTSAVETLASRSRRFNSRSRLSALIRRAEISASLCARSEAYCRTSLTAPVLAISLSMWSSLAKCREPGISNEDRGESSNNAFCLLNDGDALVKPARVAFLSLTFCDIVRVSLDTPSSAALDDFVSSSGEKEGKDVKAGSSCSTDLEEFLEPCRLGTPRSVFVFLISAEAWEVWEDERLD